MYALNAWSELVAKVSCFSICLSFNTFTDSENNLLFGTINSFYSVFDYYSWESLLPYCLSFKSIYRERERSIIAFDIELIIVRSMLWSQKFSAVCKLIKPLNELIPLLCFHFQNSFIYVAITFFYQESEYSLPIILSREVFFQKGGLVWFLTNKLFEFLSCSLILVLQIKEL